MRIFFYLILVLIVHLCTAMESCYHEQLSFEQRYKKAKLAVSVLNLAHQLNISGTLPQQYDLFINQQIIFEAQKTILSFLNPMASEYEHPALHYSTNAGKSFSDSDELLNGYAAD